MIIKKCEVCGKKFKTYQSRIKSGKGKYCSKKCHDFSLVGQPGYWLEKKRDEATKEKISIGRIGKYVDEKHPGWKGDDVGYHGLHHWVAKKLGKPTKCEHCGSIIDDPRLIHWANRSGLYLRDLTDWVRLCHSCHEKYDYDHKSKLCREKCCKTLKQFSMNRQSLIINK